MQKRAYVLVEGYGEVEAVLNLVSRISKKARLPLLWSQPKRWLNLHQWEPRSGKGGLLRGVNLVRREPDAGALLILRDEDDGCPKELAPEIATKLGSLNLPFPTAYVLLHPEYEVLFLPCVHLMIGDLPDGRPGLSPGTEWKGSWEAKRGVKEWLSAQFPRHRSYKPSLDQLPLTRKVDLDILSGADVPCFGSLERAIQFIGNNLSQQGLVYPS